MYFHACYMYMHVVYSSQNVTLKEWRENISTKLGEEYRNSMLLPQLPALQEIGSSSIDYTVPLQEVITTLIAHTLLPDQCYNL